MYPLDDGGGGKDDTLTTRGDRPSIYTVEAPHNNTYHAQRDGSRRRSWLMLLICGRCDSYGVVLWVDIKNVFGM